jgi:hypothetical protein
MRYLLLSGLLFVFVVCVSVYVFMSVSFDGYQSLSERHEELHRLDQRYSREIDSLSKRQRAGEISEDDRRRLAAYVTEEMKAERAVIEAKYKK